MVVCFAARGVAAEPAAGHESAPDDSTPASSFVSTTEQPPPLHFASELALSQKGDRHARLDGIRGFGGLVIGGGPTLHGYRPGGRGELQGPDNFGALLIALKAGVILEGAEVMFEWAPGTYRPILDEESPHTDAGDFVYSFIASAGYYIPITDGVYWPMRLGAGAGSERNDLIARLDLVGFAIKTRYVLLDLSFPSIRYMSDFDTYHRWTAIFSVGGAYVFP